MKIYVKSKKSRRFCIPLPLSLAMLVLKPVLSNYTKKKIVARVDDKSRVFVEGLDFKGLFKSIDQLKEYKGLKLVEVNDKEGNEVTIIV